MTIKELLYQYITKKIDAISTIRKLSVMYEPETAALLLSCISGITLHDQRDMTTDTFKYVFGLEDDVGLDGIVGPGFCEGADRGSTMMFVGHGSTVIQPR